MLTLRTTLRTLRRILVMLTACLDEGRRHYFERTFVAVDSGVPGFGTLERAGIMTSRLREGERAFAAVEPDPDGPPPVAGGGP